MKSFKTVSALLLCIAVNALANPDAEKYWPQWRGPLSTGVGPEANPPLQWSDTTNIKWKTVLPGEGDSTPIVWADRIFILSAVPTGKKTTEPASEKAPNEAFQFAVLCLDRSSGKILWQKVARETVPHEGRQDNNT